MQETQVQSLGWEDGLEKEMAAHSSILAWEVPWTEEHGGLQRVWHDLVTKQHRTIKFTRLASEASFVSPCSTSIFDLFLSILYLLPKYFIYRIASILLATSLHQDNINSHIDHCVYNAYIYIYTHTETDWQTDFHCTDTVLCLFWQGIFVVESRTNMEVMGQCLVSVILE